MQSRRNENGAALVEFVLVLPVFLFVIFAMVSIGVMFSFRQTLSQAATDGARSAAIAPANLTFTQRRDRAITAVNEALDGEAGDPVACGTGGLTCTIPSIPTSCENSAQCISVTLDYAYAAHPRIELPQLFGFVLPDNLTYTASARIK
jgi:hypothetical protein